MRMPKGNVAVGLLLMVSVTGVWSFVGAAGTVPAPVQAGLQAKTLRDTYTVATALEAFALDNKRYPGPTEGYVPAETLRKDLQPMYVRDLPATDAWGNPLLYWSDGETYRIVSNGADGKPDRPYDDPAAGTATLNFDGDIVFENGHLRQTTHAQAR